MYKFIKYSIALIIIISISSMVSASTYPEISPEQGNSINTYPVSDGSVNFTKIDISPRYGNLRLKPGESKETTVTIYNKEKNTVTIKPNVIISPYGEFMMEKEWLTVTPQSVDIKAGEKQKFTIKASIPQDASIGYYSSQIAFTDEVRPAPYQPYPDYVHSFGLSMDVWSIPKIQILSPYVSDRIEAGKEYNYDIKIKNTGDKAVGIAPTLGDNGYYGGPYMQNVALSNEDITITSPNSIPAGGTETIKIYIKVPYNAKGYYNAYIDIGVDDPSVREYERRIDLNFNIWKQPIEAFVKNFSLKQDSPLIIEINSNRYNYGYASTKNTVEPSFDTTLESSGVKAELNHKKTVIKGSVSMGGDIPPWEIESMGIYQETNTQYIETYTTNAKAGDWKLKILPKNTEMFEYSIIIGE